jgi:O-antigen/teichoic acid export membrane protein
VTAQDDQSVATGSAWLFWAQVVGNAGFFAAVLVLARGLEPAGRGAVAFVTVTALISARVTRLGVTEATEVFVAQRPGRRPVLLSNLLAFSAVSATVAAVVVCGVLLALGDARPDGVGPEEVVILGAGLVVTALVDAGYTVLVGLGRFREQALVTASSSWLYAVLLAVLWAADVLTIGLAVLAWTISQALRALPLLVVSVRAVGLARPEWPLVREALGFGLRGWIGTLARFFSFRLDQILMAFLASEAALGLYAVAVNASEVLLYLPQAMNAAILPAIARSDVEHRTRQTVEALRSLLLVTTVGVLVAAAAGPLVLPAVFGSAYDGSVAPFLLLLPGTLGYAVLGVFSRAMLASGAPGRSSAGAVAAVVVGVALDFVLIPAYGASGAAAAASAGFIAGGVVAVAIYRSQHPFPWTELLVPSRRDLLLVRALVRPLARRRGRAARRG